MMDLLERLDDQHLNSLLDQNSQTVYDKIKDLPPEKIS